MMESTLRKLREALTKLETVGEAVTAFMASPFMLVLASQTHFIQVNDRWTVELGWTKEELLGRPWREFIHPDDLPSTDVAATLMEQEAIVGTFKNRYLTKDGDWKTLWWVAQKWEEGQTFAIALPAPITEG